MGLLQIHSPIAIFLSSRVSSSHSKPPCLPRFQDSAKKFGQSSLFSSSPGIGDGPFSLSTVPRKLLCTPPRGKHVREDYLVKKLSAQEVQELVRGERSVPLIIDFYATWCGPCILMAQELEMLAVEYENNAIIVKVDTDDEYDFARDMQVRGLPTLYFISPDPTKEAIRTEGLIPIQMMRDILDNEM
ncbi:thioredoxin-like protein CITRX, chloroplastic [Rhodamnia argentea]|uniref:Thioredoxin-like protein CITRX, chloroplastic n=1 Tax=Rhodamnia argentea TaxID=178133 RepID=A0A8B8PDQ8_9MYRT|nr:thioredoxin-like protein CITRX, chloroplastic [Rhodamnia argentea]XP_048134466.1 thioredoxin-like protein CITRX, chloroplastic [Rhodamnia argentea]